MKASNLQLNNYFVRELSFSLNENFTGENIERMEIPSLEVKCSFISLPESINQKKCEIEISLKEKSRTDFPYHFGIILSGLFTISTEIDAENGERLYRVNAPALLYSAAREIVYNLTNHSNHAPFLLPSVTFVDELEFETKSVSAKKRTVRKRKKEEG